MTTGQNNSKEFGTTVVLYPDNYINDIEGEKLEDLCDIYLARGFTKIIIDFSHTDLINSIGVSILIGIIENIRDKKGEIVFCGLKRVNYDIFDMVGLTKHIRVVDNEKDAFAVRDVSRTTAPL